LYREYAKLYTEIGLGTTIWSPLASGLLTGALLLHTPPLRDYTTPAEICLGKYSKDSFPEGSRLAEGRFENKVKFLRDGLLSGKGLNGLETTGDILLLPFVRFRLRLWR